MKNILLIVVTCLVFSSVIMAQNGTVGKVNSDSLYSIWTNKGLPPVKRIQAGDKLVQYFFRNPEATQDTAVNLALANLKLAQSFGIDSLIGNAHFRAGITHQEALSYPNAIVQYQKGLVYFKKTKNYKNLLNSYLYIGFCYKVQNKLDSAIAYLKKIEAFPVYKNQYFEHKDYMKLYIMFSDVYRDQLDYKNAQAALLKADSVNENHLNSMDSKITILRYLARLYNFQRDYTKEMKLMQDAYSLLDSTDSDNSHYTVLSDLAYAYFHQDNFEKAIALALQALEYANKIGFLTNILHEQTALAKYYGLQEKNDKALEYSQQAMETYQEMGDDYSSNVSTLYADMGILHYQMGNYKKGLSCCQQAENTEEQDLYSKLATLECYYKNYEGTGNYEKAFEYLLEHGFIEDSLKSDERYQQIAQLEEQLKFQKKEKEIEKVKILAVEEAKIQRQQRNAMFGGLVLLALTLGAGGLAYRNSRKHNAYLAEEEKRKELLLQEVHHRTNNSLQLISALLTMQSYQVDDPKAKSFLKQSESRIHSMSALHEMLHSNATQIEVNIAEYLENVIDFHQTLSAHPVEITSNIHAQLFPAKLALPIALITNELITNSIKYAFTPNANNAHIHVNLNETDIAGQWLLSVSDNGKGLPADAYTNGSGNIGTKLITILSKQLDGKLSISHDNGATVSVTFNPKLN